MLQAQADVHRGSSGRMYPGRKSSRACTAQRQQDVRRNKKQQDVCSRGSSGAGWPIVEYAWVLRVLRTQGDCEAVCNNNGTDSG